MLGKLIKYEFKATARFLLPLYIALLAFAGLNKLFLVINADFLKIPTLIASITYGILIVATFAITALIIIQRFYKNLLSNEGYLMFTIPVKTSQNIIAKLIIAAFWVLISFIVAAISVLILSYTKDLLSQISTFIKLAIDQINFSLGTYAPLIIVEVAGMLLISLVSTVLMVYSSISIGQLMNKNKLLGAFGAFVALNVVYQIIASIILVICSNFSNIKIFVDTFSAVPQKFIAFALGGILILDVILVIAYFLTSKIILSKKLNLE